MEPLVIFSLGLVVYCCRLSFAEAKRDWKLGREARMLGYYARGIVPGLAQTFQPVLREWRNSLLTKALRSLQMPAGRCSGPGNTVPAYARFRNDRHHFGR